MLGIEQPDETQHRDIAFEVRESAAGITIHATAAD
jgi:hypothetical protein